MTLYLLRDRERDPASSSTWPSDLHAEDRFFAARRALLSGPFEVVGSLGGTACRRLGRAPCRSGPSHGVYVVVGPPVDGAGVGRSMPGWPASGSSPTASARSSPWPSSTVTSGRSRTALGTVGRELGATPEWAGPLERVDAFRWDWFATLTPQ